MGFRVQRLEVVECEIVYRQDQVDASWPKDQFPPTLRRHPRHFALASGGHSRGSVVIVGRVVRGLPMLSFLSA
jgi:hypothetical protein